MKIVLYGAGTQNLRMAYQPLVSAGYDVSYICDADVAKQGSFFSGVEIISPQKLFELACSESLEIIITIRTKALVEEVKTMLADLQNANVYTFDEFIEAKKLNGKIKRFSCVMVHLTDHCNLSCVRCSHFSPLAKKEFYVSIESFERDCRRLAELTKGDVDEFQLSGGEPLLHPQVALFPYIVRKYFKNTQIIIITNSIKLEGMSEEFYRSCYQNKVNIWISQYPLKIDYQSIIKKLEEKGITVVFGNSGNSQEKPKEMWGVPFRLNGGMDGQHNFDCCLCMQYIIRNGRMYPCPNSAYVDLFNNYFGKELPGPEINGVDIYEVESLEELTSKISNPIPLCEFCDSQHRMEGIPWRASEKDICEWSLL